MRSGLKQLAMGIALATSLVTAPLRAAAVPGIAAGDPAAVAAALTAMGYKPGAIDPNDGMPMFSVEINKLDTVVVLGDCTGGKACKYMLLVSRFTDVKNPPAAWLNARNAELDLGKLWLTPEGVLAFSLPVPTGNEGLAPAALRYVLDQWMALVGSISQSAVNEKLAG